MLLSAKTGRVRETTPLRRLSHKFEEMKNRVIIHRLRKKLHFTMILCSFLIVTFLSDYMSIWYLDILYKVLLGICFIGIGLLCSRFAIVEKTPICVDCVLLIIGLLLAQKNGSVEMAAGNIGNSVIYFLCATALP